MCHRLGLQYEMTTGKPSLAMQQLDGAIKTLNTMQYAEPIYAVLLRVRAGTQPAV